MRNKLAATTVAIAAAACATAALAAGPRPSSENYIPNQPAGVALSSADPAMAGPRPSSANHIAAMPPVARVAAAAAPHYVYEQGYDHHGWHGHWVLVR